MNDQNLQINSRIQIPFWEIVFTASRSGGPGGQHVNKTNSRITLHWSIQDTSSLSEIQKKRVLKNLSSRVNHEGVLLFHVEESRSQHRNKEIALERLKNILLEALKVPKKRKPTKPSKASKERRLSDKKSRSTLKNLRKKITE